MIDWDHLQTIAPFASGILMTRHYSENGDDDDEPEMERRSLWRYVPVTVIMFLTVQTAGAIWWASAMNSNQSAMSSQIAELKTIIYTRSEAALVQQNNTLRNGECERRVLALEERLQDHIEHDVAERKR